MEITLTRELEAFVEDQVAGGRYADASDVMRDALRKLEQDNAEESPALEAALIEGVRSEHQDYSFDTLARVRDAAASGKSI